MTTALNMVAYLWQQAVSTFCCSCRKKYDLKETEQEFEALSKTEFTKKARWLLNVTDFGNLMSCYSDQVSSPTNDYYAPQRLNGIIYGSNDIRGIVRI